MIDIHFLNVGQGNMTVLLFGDGSVLYYDCNITDDNERSVFSYLSQIMGKNSIDVFVCSHREADHMRGIKKLNQKYPINSLWDSGVSGNIIAPEYREYMDLRRNLGTRAYEVGAGQHWTNKPYVKILNGKRSVGDINAQSIVLHVDNNGASVLLTGDTDAKVWSDYIIPQYGDNVSSSIMLASHHGSISFFDDPRDERNYYVGHIKKINPAMTIISVGQNPHGHPDATALQLYEKHSRGSNQGNRVFRTDIHGNVKLSLKDDGSWTVLSKQ